MSDFQKHLIFLILQVLLLDILNTTANKIPLQGTFPDSSSRCGDTLRSPIGTISYKNFDSYLPNERCVWTLRAPNATSYSVYVDTIGTPNSYTLQISGFGVRDSVFHTSASTPVNVTVANSNVVVITFYTPSTNNTYNYKGFALRYEASYSASNDKASGLSEDIIVSANTGLVNFPSSRSTYDNNELSILMVTPLSGVYTTGRKTEVTYIRNGLEDQSCHDKISVYTFDINISGTNRWKSLGRMCGGVDSELISSSDLIMLVFESDGSSESSGFNLYTRSVVI